MVNSPSRSFRIERIVVTTIVGVIIVASIWLLDIAFRKITHRPRERVADSVTTTNSKSHVLAKPTVQVVSIKQDASPALVPGNEPTQSTPQLASESTPLSFARNPNRKVSSDADTYKITDLYWLDENRSIRPITHPKSGRFLAAEPPRFEHDTGDLTLQSSSVRFDLRIKPQDSIRGILIEASRTKDFAAQHTSLKWTPKNVISLKISAPGIYYFRVRGVNARRELTAWSKPRRLIARIPKPVIRPMQIQARASRVPKSAQPDLEFSSETRAESVASVEESLNRDPASDFSTVKSSTTVSPKSRSNQMFDASSIAVEGAAFTMFSQEQDTYGHSPPEAATIGLRFLKWFDANGVEGVAKSKVFGINSDGRESGLRVFELRYHRRWPLSFNPFFSKNTARFSLLGGYEVYRNPGGVFFSPGYDLFKLGFALAFPMASKWATGGEVLGGYGFDASRKLEISGFIHYFIFSELSLGAGYRVHFFEAGSASAAPASLPYREAYGEGYSSVKYHF